MKKPPVLIVEDDPAIQKLIAQTLAKEGYNPLSAKSIAEARKTVALAAPGLIILDRRLPDGDGLELCRDLKSGGSFATPILFLTSKNSTSDKVVGLKMGADDYLTKPFDLDELLARVEALLRRAGENPSAETAYSFAGLTLDCARHACSAAGKPVKLWPKEFELLRLFLSSPERVLSKEFISSRIWGHSFIDTSRAIEMSVRRLRAKLGAKSCLIRTVKGYGFILSEKTERAGK